MPHDESKDDIGVGTGSDLPTVVENFTLFMTGNEDVNSSIEAFIEDNCAEFEGVGADDEQKLEWTALHEKFVELIEVHLESFCKEHDTTAEEVFTSISEVKSSKTVSQDFVPQVINMCEYPFFFENMVESANARVNKRKAAAMAVNSSAKLNFSGCYSLAAEHNEAAEVERYYKFCGAPWYFRKLLVAATNRMQEVLIQHEDQEFLEFKYSLQFFGRKTNHYNLDGVTRETENMWGKKNRTQCSQDNRAGLVRVKVCGPSYARSGYGENIFEYVEKDGEELLCWSRQVFMEDRDEDPAVDGEGIRVGPKIYFRANGADTK